MEVWVENVGCLGEERILGREEVGDSGTADRSFFFKGAFEEDAGAEGVEADFARVAFLVSVAGGDVHD